MTQPLDEQTICDSEGSQPRRSFRDSWLYKRLRAVCAWFESDWLDPDEYRLLSTTPLRPGESIVIVHSNMYRGKLVIEANWKGNFPEVLLVQLGTRRIVRRYF